MKLGVIGFGNMGQGIICGLLRAKKIKPQDIYVCEKNFDKCLINSKKYKVNPCKDALEVIKNTDYIILAVKNNVVDKLIKSVLNELKNKVLISIVIGFDSAYYENLLNASTHHISTIPNLPIAVQDGILIVENKNTLTEEEYKIFKNLFKGVALIEEVDTSKFNIAGIIAGCGIAFTSMYIEALADASIQFGLSREEAFTIASQMIIGTGKMYLVDKIHPAVIKDTVCSPGGKSIKGVTELEEKGFRGAVIKAIDAILKDDTKD